MKSSRVLIETLWNVKRIPGSKRPPPLARINRNIVECKDKRKAPGTYYERCINRNIVECKERRYREMVEESRSINRNIVECKDLY